MDKMELKYIVDLFPGLSQRKRKRLRRGSYRIWYVIANLRSIVIALNYFQAITFQTKPMFGHFESNPRSYLIILGCNFRVLKFISLQITHKQALIRYLRKNIILLAMVNSLSKIVDGCIVISFTIISQGLIFQNSRI